MKKLAILLVAVGIGILILLTDLLADAIQLFRFWGRRLSGKGQQQKVSTRATEAWKQPF